MPSAIGPVTHLYKGLPLFMGAALPRIGSPMALATLLLCAISLGLLSYGQPEALGNHNSSDLLYTCNKIVAAISGASQVFFPRKCVILSFLPI